MVMKRRIESPAQQAVRELRLRVKFLCCTKGVKVIDIVHYQNFAAEIQKARRKIHGKDLEIFAGCAVADYERRGLDRGMLREVLYGIFTMRLQDTE